ncbi:hypothetical protein QYE76_056367 [Lolium multiflorum]|uniref:Reverse transcriptase Ty1/copia-type domain-containing protein n=1 Tax=Lolium multiflorum TaxID=4521 RepID=A0AAD8T372_LOLMU|nr:hypothetical protein QYE76_056367 [Lolium multiflorum]
MHDELNNFERNKVGTLVEKPKECRNVIGTKWIFKNKQDEHGIIVRNKARLVAQGFYQTEGINFGETYALVARLESIRILLAYASHHNFKLQQMDVKSAFINGPLHEEVYVKQPPGFEDPNFPNHVYKLDKALYGLKQDPRAWNEHLKVLTTQGLSGCLLEGSFTSKEVEARWDLLERIEENAEGWENNKGYADKPSFKPLPPKEGNEEKGEKKKKKKKKKKENKKKEVTAYPRVNEITLGNRKYVAPNDYYDNESEYDDLPMLSTYTSDHDLNEHTTFDIANLWETNSENDDDNN